MKGSASSLNRATMLVKVWEAGLEEVHKVPTTALVEVLNRTLAVRSKTHQHFLQLVPKESVMKQQRLDSRESGASSLTCKVKLWGWLEEQTGPRSRCSKSRLL